MNYPPFVSYAGRSQDDHCSEDGARRLAATIREAWAAVGVHVPCEIRRAVRSHQGNTRADVWTVDMPTLVNGLPVEQPT